MVTFLRAITRNEKLHTSLKELNISHNKLEKNGTSELMNFIGKAKALTKLDVSSTNLNIQILLDKVLLVTCL